MGFGIYLVYLDIKDYFIYKIIEFQIRASMFYPKTYKLLYFIVKNFKKNLKRSPNRTELIKLLYLTDLEYFKSYGEKYSELNYIFYNYGPWTRQYHQILDYMINQEIIEDKKFSNEDAWSYSIANKKPRHDVELENDISTILENNFFIYKDSVLTQILKVVYTTEPIISTKRGEKIDFTKVPLNIRNKRLQYKEKRKKQLEKISKLQNNIGDHDLELLEAFKPFRDRANELI